MNPFPRLPVPYRRRVFIALLALALSAGGGPVRAGEARTFTSKDGRSIEAEIVSHKGETLRIRRSDTGREMQLPVSALAEDDQKSARKFIRDNPDLRETVKPGDIRVEFSRAKFEREKTSDYYYVDTDAENWGFSIAVLNQTGLPIEGLRLEYVVYARRDPDNVESMSRSKTEPENLERITGQEELKPIPSGQRVAIRTKPVVSIRTKYSDGVRIYTADGKLRRSWRDKALHGVWFRVYDGDKLVHEACSPDGLRNSEAWGDAR